jgi:Ca2+-binding EF-hand superfamily protein
LDATELKRVFTKLGEHMTDKEMEDQIKDFDLDRDGEMNCVEFVVMVQSCKGIDFGLE